MLSDLCRNIRLAAICWLVAHDASAEVILRAGIVGCDTSHAVAFTKLINDPAAQGPRAQVEVVCAFAGGSEDIPSSRDRVAGFTEQLRAGGVEIVPTIEEIRDKCDVILLESVDGRTHLPQFRQLACGKPVFIDKPAAASLADVMAVFRLAEQTKTPCFSSSALRFSEQIQAIKNSDAVGEITGCSVASPFQTEPHHPDLFWYGVHGVESIYALMNRGCESVSRIGDKHDTVVVGKWEDGRLAEYRGLRHRGDYTFAAYGAKGVAINQGFSGYQPLVEEICKFFLTGKPPVPPQETIEMFAFMEAADESLRREGQAVSIKEIMARAGEQQAPNSTPNP
jgi:predicted dehydrogenase